MAVGFIVAGATPKPNPADVTIAGLKQFPGITAVRVGPDPVDYKSTYDMNPPAGGDHFAAWLNRGVYDQPQPNENAVLSLEYGAVWVTYDPAALDETELSALRSSVPSTYSVVSPFPGLPAPVVISAWGTQVQLDGVDDSRLQSFIQKYWKSAPEFPARHRPGRFECRGRIRARHAGAP